MANLNNDETCRATYVSVWDDKIKIKTPCVYNGETNIVSDIKLIDVDGLDMCTDEYLILQGGAKIRDFIMEDNIWHH